MKQTAVEWLINKLDGENHLSINEINRIVKQAKEMEKEQIIEAHNSGYSEGIYQSCESGDEYYNETFKSE